jgi:hypothetical protein
MFYSQEQSNSGKKHCSCTRRLFIANFGDSLIKTHTQKRDHLSRTNVTREVRETTEGDLPLKLAMPTSDISANSKKCQ